jgi:thymidine kinase
MRNPSFTIYTGPMFGSKTTRLLADVDRLKYKSKNVIAFKPNIDKRYSDSRISSHSGGSIEAHCINDAEDIYKIIESASIAVDTIAVDEAFMIENIDTVLINLYRKGFSIIVSSIQLDAGEVPFENMKNIFPLATKIEVCPAVCTLCDNDAYFTFPLFDINNASQEEKVGGKELYEPRCMKHYFQKDI